MKRRTTQTSSTGADVLEALVAKALDIGAYELEVEYKDGYEKVFARSGNLGLGIAALRSTSKEARSLREQLRTIGKRGKNIEVSGATYRLRATIYDSFGEDAFRVEITGPVTRSSGL